MTQPQPARSAQNRWIIAALWLFLYGSFALLSPPLLDGADASCAEGARQMLLRGDMATLPAGGACPAHTPLLYWAAADSMGTFGVGAAQARLPLAGCALLLFLLVEMFAREAFRSSRAGLYASAILLLSPGMFGLSRVLSPAVPVCLALVAAVFCLWRAEVEPPGRNGSASMLPCLGFAASCATNLLLGGWGGVLVTLAVAAAYLLLLLGPHGTLRRLRRCHPLAASAVFLLLLSPWFLLLTEEVSATTGRAARHAAGQMWQAASAPATGLVPAGSAGLSLSLLVLLPLAGLLPWSGSLPGALRGVPWRKPWTRQRSPEARVRLLLAVAAAVPLVASIVLRNAAAGLPSLPFLAMLLAPPMDREAAEAESMTVPATLGGGGVRMASVLLTGGVLMAVLCAALALRGREPGPHADRAVLFAADPARGDSVVGYVLHLNAAALGVLRTPLLLTAAVLLAGTVLNWQLRRAFQPHRGNLALAGTTLLLLSVWHTVLNTVSPALTSQGLATALLPQLRPKNIVVVNGDAGGAAPTLTFYLGNGDLHVLHREGADTPDGIRFSDTPPHVETEASLRMKWLGPERIFLVTDTATPPPLPGKAYIVAEGGNRQVVSNKAGPY